MRAVIVNKSDERGGAAVVSLRLMHALRAAGVDARMLVAERLGNDPYVEAAATPMRVKVPFMIERAQVFAANGFNRSTLFKIDPASQGLPLWHHRLIREADVVLLNWVNQGMLSLDGVDKIAASKPVIWTMHDLWCATGVCHHSGGCERFRECCGNCPLLDGKASPDDMSRRVHQAKQRLYGRRRLHFVAVSSWLERRCRESSLLRDADISVIPNPFSLPDYSGEKRRCSDKRIRAVVAAARLDDDVKGFPILLDALRRLAEVDKRIAERLHITFCGNIRNRDLLNQTAVDWEWKGAVAPEGMPDVYRDADMVISSSRYETLPGTLVEGQAFGALPVAFDRGGQRDIVEHGATGVLAPFGDGDAEAAGNLASAILDAVKIIDSVDSQELTLRLRESVRSRFAAQAVAERYIELINSCLSVK